MPLTQSKTLSISIDCSVNEAYHFISNPANLPRWTGSFFKFVKKVNDQWVAETPDGLMNIRFVEQNEFGILDHYITPEPDRSIMNPMRVLANGSGCEVIFTLFQYPEMSQDQFIEDSKMVEQDLNTLKEILEHEHL